MENAEYSKAAIVRASNRYMHIWPLFALFGASAVLTALGWLLQEKEKY